MPLLSGTAESDPALEELRKGLATALANIEADACLATKLNRLLSVADRLLSVADGLRVSMDVLLDRQAIPPPPAPVKDWPPSVQPVANSKVILTVGVKQGAYHFDNSVNLVGAGMRRTVIDAQGGASFGKHDAWGKGNVHIEDTNLLIEDIGFIHAGTLGGGLSGSGAQARSDGEAGAYGEASAVGNASLHLLRCAFDTCENGIFVPPWQDKGKNTTLVIDGCVFGATGPNGLTDERSHDIYSGAKSTVISRSIFAGNSRGHQIKVRGPSLTVYGNYIARSNRRWIDCPGPTNVTSARNIYVTLPGASSNSAMAFVSEDDFESVPNGQTGHFLSTEDTFYFSRATEVIWANHPNYTVEFKRPMVYWVGPTGARPPVIAWTGAGTVIGRSLFRFTESNRVNAAPDMPADPVA